MKRWNKKGQFFLIAAVITIMIIFTITAEYNTVRQMVELQDFAELSGAYNTEQPKVLNSAIFEGQDPATQAQTLHDFTEQYVEFARQREPTYGVLYAYKDALGNVHIVNSLTDKAISVKFNQGGEVKDLRLFGDTTAVGSICSDIVGNTICSTASTDIENFGGGLTATELQNAEEIRFDVEVGGQTRTVVVDLANSGFLNYQAAGSPTPLGVGTPGFFSVELSQA